MSDKQHKELWDKRLEDIFKKTEQSETDVFMSIVSMIIYNNVKCTDIANLYTLMGLDNFLKIVTLFESRTIEFPSKKEIKDAVELALIYYYKKVHNFSYEQLRELPIFKGKELSSISIGKKIVKLQKEIALKLENIDELFNFEEEDLK